MKKLDQYQKFADELKELCEKHKVGLVGTCSTEGIYGEITMVDLDDVKACGWHNVEEQINFEVNELQYPNDPIIGYQL